MPMIAENISVVEINTGEILTDIGRNGKEKTVEVTQGGGAKSG